MLSSNDAKKNSHLHRCIHATAKIWTSKLISFRSISHYRTAQSKYSMYKHVLKLTKSDQSPAEAAAWPESSLAETAPHITVTTANVTMIIPVTMDPTAVLLDITILKDWFCWTFVPNCSEKCPQNSKTLRRSTPSLLLFLKIERANKRLIYSKV